MMTISIQTTIVATIKIVMRSPPVAVSCTLPDAGRPHKMNEHSFFDHRQKILGAHVRSSPLYPIPAGLDDSGNQEIVQRDETENVVPGGSKQRAEGQIEEEDEGQVFHHLLRNRFFE